MEDYGLVSIILPAYNAERYIKDAIESILKQTYLNFELIVVNDGSKDRTLEIAKSFKDERINLIDLKENKGVSYARNVALDIAKGKWIAFAAADDLWKPERLEYLLNIISKYEYGKYFIADDMILCYETNNGKLVRYGSEIRLWFPGIYRKFGSSEVIEIGYKDFLYIAFHPILPSKVVQENKFKFPENLSLGEDLYFYAKLFKSGLKMLLTKKSYYFYRIRPGSLTDLGIEEFINKVKNFEKALESDKEFNAEDKELFKKYFDSQIEIRTRKEIDLNKNDLLIHGLKGLVIAFLKNPYLFFRFLFNNLSNPYKIVSLLRLVILAGRGGGIKRV